MEIKALYGAFIAVLSLAPAASLGATTVVIEPGDSGRYLVPTSGSLGQSWIAPGFNDSAWTAAPTGYGFGSVGSATIETNVGPQMQGTNSSLYARIPFQISNPATISALDLSIWADDGFVAWINGVQVATSNAPAMPVWNSVATAAASELAPLAFDLSGAIGNLVAGQNMLSIHGLNSSPSSSDFLVSPTLTVEAIPEPTGGTLALLGGLLLTLRRRR